MRGAPIAPSKRIRASEGGAHMKITKFKPLMAVVLACYIDLAICGFQSLGSASENRQRDVELDDTPAAHHRAGLGWQLLRGGGPPRHRPRRFVLCGLGVAGGYLFLPRFQRDGERKLRRTPKMTTKACCRRRALTVTMCYYDVAAPERGAVGVSRSITWQVKLHKRTHQVFENKGFSFWLRDEPIAARPRSPI
jgi:hypothetical protein